MNLVHIMILFVVCVVCLVANVKMIRCLGFGLMITSPDLCDHSFLLLLVSSY